MSKLSFRARHLDPSKQMPIFLAEELPDLPEYSAINRAVPQMPSGMEKEEESEHHLQRAICTGLIIPTPEVYATDQTFYDTYYPDDYKMPRQMIHMQPLGLDTDVPDYDMDTADEEWLSQQSQRLDLTELKFEQLMDRLEKSSGQTVITLNEAKALLKEDDEISISVYDYWLNKRLKMQHPLILTVKTENRPGASSNNPYLAFRRRTEKMQTRKNRKNDEASYEKMLKLRRDLQRATTMLEMVKKREETKRDQLEFNIGIFEKRVQMRDFNGAVYSELCSQIKSLRPAFTPLYTNQYSHHSSSAASTPTGALPGSIASVGGALAAGVTGGAQGVGGNIYATATQYLNSSNVAIDAVNTVGGSSRKEKRQYKKRKHKLPREKQQQQQYLAGVGIVPAQAGASTPQHLSHLHHLHRQSSSPVPIESNIETEEEDFASGSGQNGNKMGSESEEEAPFAFRRRQSCNYLRTRENIGHWPWETTEDGVYGDPKYRYTLTSLSHPRPRCIGFARRRLGRGGRILFDRASTNFDDFWSQLDYTVLESVTSTQTIKKVPPKPSSPPTVVDLPVKSMEGTTPAVAITEIKSEVSEDTNINKTEDTESGNLLNDDEDDEDEGLCTEDENISRIDAYSSALTLGRGSLEIRTKRRRLRRKNRREVLELNAAKRQKFVGDENNEHDSKLKPLPPRLLRQLARSMDCNGYQSMLLSERVKHERLNENAEADTDKVEVMADTEQHAHQDHDKRANHQHHRSNNNTVSINNNNSSSNINKNVSINENFNVIKQELATASATTSVAVSPSPSNNSASAVEEVAKTIKQELIDADDSNEPLISMRKSTTTPAAADIVEDEDNVNLAQLSNIIRHTVKMEQAVNAETTAVKTKVTHQEDSTEHENLLNDCDSTEDTCFNQIPDVIRLRNLQKQERNNSLGLFIDADAIVKNEDDADYMGSLSPTSSQRLDICNELLSEIRRDWLHFRPKTPSDELSDLDDNKLFDVNQPLVDWSQDTPIAVEMHRLSSTNESSSNPGTITLAGDADPFFLSSNFKYTELEADTQLMQSAYSLDLTRGSSKSPEVGNSNSTLDFNLSGDSLTDINLLGDVDEADENMLDNILQECAMDDIKILNQATNFWNGILDGEGAVDDVANVDVDADEGLLDSIDDKKAKGVDSKRAARGKDGKSRLYNGLLGCSNFTVIPAVHSSENGLTFFSQKPPKQEPVPEIEIKEEPPEITSNILAKPVAAQAPTVEVTTPQVINIPAQQQQQQLQQQPVQQQQSNQTPTPIIGSTSQFVNVSQGQLLLCTPQEFQQQKIAQISAELSTAPTTQTAAVGDIVTIAPHTSNILSRHTILQQQLATFAHVEQQQQQQQQSQHQLPKQQQHQLQQIQLRNVAIQQRQPQQQILLPMQRDLATTSLLTQQHIPTSNTSVVTALPVSISSTLAPVTVRSQGGLTSISGTTTGNHMIYTTTSGDIIATSSPGTSQKVAYTLQKSSISSAAQVPSTLGSNTVITLSNVKLQTDGSHQQNTLGQASNTNMITIDSNNTPVAVSSSNVNTTAAGGGVNIINTSSGQQVSVHNIGAGGSVQHLVTPSMAGGIVSSQQISTTTTTPLIFTTTARNNAQQMTQQHLVQGQPTQQIVWRQVGGTSVAGTNTAVISMSGDTPTTAVANKILWTNRPAQKRQTNGPDSTDINKLLLNRKFTQRKVVAQQSPQQQQQQQHQIQITKQHLQQLQQQQQQQQQQLTTQHVDDDVNTSNNEHITIQETTVSTSDNHQQQQQQQSQLQKVQMSKVIKMSSFPMLVSDMNLQQQQHQHQQQTTQQKQSSAAAIAANHNYSLQPTAIITSQAQGGTQQGNKIYLTSSNSSTTGNFTTAAELQAAAAAAAAASGQTTTTQKIHYKDLQNSNLKLNFITTAAAAGGQHESNVITHQQQLGATTVLLNKASGAASLQHQQKLKTVTSVANSATDNNKRVLYTSLLNVKPLQKNNASPMQMQIGPGGLHHVLRGRLANNPAIFTTNVRTLPLGTTVNSTSVAGGGGGGGGGNVQMAASTTIRQLMSTNNISSEGAVTSAAPTTVTKELNKGLTVEQIVSVANNGGISVTTSNANNNNNGNNGGSNGGANTNASCVTINANASSSSGGGGTGTTTINR